MCILTEPLKVQEIEENRLFQAQRVISERQARLPAFGKSTYKKELSQDAEYVVKEPLDEVQHANAVFI